MPVKVQCQISEVLGAIFVKDTPERKRMIDVEQEKFRELYRRMLKDNGHPNLLQIMHDMTNEKISEFSDEEGRDMGESSFEKAKPHDKVQETREKFLSPGRKESE